MGVRDRLRHGWGEYTRLSVLDGLTDAAEELLKGFTPAGLEHFINSGLSIVDEVVKELPPEELRRYAEKAEGYRDAAATISDADVLANLYERLPEHVRVLRQHPTWFGAELARLRRLLFPPKVDQARILQLAPKRKE